MTLFHPFILCYHQISEHRLRSHVRFLKLHFDIVPLRELTAAVFEQEGKRPPRRLLALTMDDCYERDFANANAVCQSEQVPCTFFLPVQYALEGKGFWPQRMMNLFEAIHDVFVDEKGAKIQLPTNMAKNQLLRQYFITYNQNDVQTVEIERMVDKLYTDNGIAEQKTTPVLSIEAAKAASNDYITFESHSLTHPKLYRCDQTAVMEELADSKKIMSELLGVDSRFFCYPYGSERHIGESWKQVGKHYDYGFTLKKGVVTRRTNPMLLPRIDVYEQDSILKLLAKVLVSQLRN